MFPKMPTIDDFEKLRDDFQSYGFFCYYFLPIVVGKRTFFNQLQTGAKLSDIAMSSDEAFGIVALINGMAKWKWEKDNPTYRTTKDRISTERPASIYSNGVKGDARKYEGWNHEGTKKFNELVKKVNEDRAKEDERLKSFDDYFAEIAYVYSNGRVGRGESRETQYQEEPADIEQEAVMELT